MGTQSKSNFIHSILLFFAKLKKIPNKKEVASWGLYDFANTIYSMNVVTMYFSQWIVVDNGKEDIWYSLALSLSMLFVALTVPYLGVVSDKAGKRMPFLMTMTFSCVIATALISVAGYLITDVDLRVIIGLLLFVIANYSYQGGLVFYDALLPVISTPKTIGKVSGFGVALGYLGAILGLLMVMPIVTRYGRLATFLPTAIFFLLFALPIFIFVKDRKRPESLNLSIKGQITFKKITGHIFKTLRSTQKFPGVLRFLIANFFYANAINTIIAFMAIYANQVMGYSDEVKIPLFIVSTTSAIIGSFLCGLLTDKMGPKRTLQFVLLGWVIVLITVIFTSNNIIFWICGAFVGAFMGSVWTSARPLLAQLSPKEMAGEFFGLYALSGKMAAIMGPIVWGITVFIFGKLGYDIIKYRFGVASMLLLMLIGFTVLIKVPDKKRE